MLEVAQHQRLGADAAVDVGIGVEMTQAGGHGAYRIDRHLDRRSGQRRPLVAALRRHRIARHERGQGPVRPAERLLDAKQHRQLHVARLRVAFGELAIGIELPLRLAKQRHHLRGSRLAARRDLQQLGDVDVARVDLRLAEEHGIADDLGFGAGQQVGHARVHLARPGPAADVVDAGVVDRDHRYALGRFLRGRLHADVVGLALQAWDEIAETAEEKHGDDDYRAEKPVGPPEAGFHAASPPAMQLHLFLKTAV